MATGLNFGDGAVMLATVYGAVEMAKALGLPAAIKTAIFGKSSALTADEKKAQAEDREAAAGHYEACRGCAKCQDKQVQILEKINDGVVAINATLKKNW